MKHKELKYDKENNEWVGWLCPYIPEFVHISDETAKETAKRWDRRLKKVSRA